MESINKELIINFKNFRDIPITKIKDVLKIYHFVILRNYIKSTDALDILNKVKSKFKPSNDKIRKPSDYDKVKSNYQRLMIGNTGGIKLTNPRYFRVFYNPTFCKDIYGAKNIYAGVPVIIGSKGVEKVIELNLSKEEKDNFEKSVKAVKELFNAAKKIDSEL